MDSDKENLRQAFINIGVKYSQGITKDKRKAEWIIDSRPIILTQKYAEILGNKFSNFLKKYPSATHIGGLEITSIPLVTTIVNKTGLKGFIVRKERKNSGLQKIIEGNNPSKKKVIIIDDLLNSGYSILRTIKKVQLVGAEVIAVFCIVNCENKGQAILEEKNIPLEFIFNLKDLYLRNSENHDIGSKIDSAEILWTIDEVNLWEHPFPRSNPLYHNGFVYFGTNEGIFFCIDPNDGKEIWRRTYPMKNPKKILSSPIGKEQNIYFGDYSGMLRCLHFKTGENIWQARRGEWIGSSPKIWNDYLYIGIEYGERYGLCLCSSAINGKIKWYQKTKDYVHSTPEICEPEKIIVIGCNDGYVYLNHAETGILYDKINIGKEIKAGFCYDEGNIYFGAFDGYAYCYNISEKKIFWRRKIGDIIYTTPIVKNESVIFTSMNNKILSFQKRNGIINWVFNSYGQIYSSPTIDKNKIYFGGMDGSLYCIDLNSGRLIKKYQVNLEIVSKPLIIEDKAILSCRGKVICIKL